MPVASTKNIAEQKELRMAARRSGIKRIVVGVDGSAQSAAALKWAVRIAKGMGSQITAVYAIHLPLYLAPEYGVPFQFDEEWRDQMRTEFEDKWCKRLRASGIRYRTVMEDGRPAPVIAAVADRENADIVVVGRRGRGGVAELVLGSVSHELVLSSKRPVLLISLDSSRNHK
jgi:nucleotide-binding universal stress UspA family protein